MEKPSFKSSPWIRGAPHRVFSRDIRRTRWRISLDTGGRPGFLRRDFHVQKSLNPLWCQPMTVSGLTITRAWRQPGHRQDRMTQKTLSAFRSDGRGLFRFRTATCCRRARISVWSAARSAKISMILCMPERVSGGDAKFQGFCDRWNKWEGHAAGSPSPSMAPVHPSLPGPLAGGRSCVRPSTDGPIAPPELQPPSPPACAADWSGVAAIDPTEPPPIQLGPATCSPSCD